MPSAVEPGTFSEFTLNETMEMLTNNMMATMAIADNFLNKEPLQSIMSIGIR